MKQKIKYLQSLIAVALCVILSLAFTSCSDDDDDDSVKNPIVGTWRLSMQEPGESNEFYYCQYNFKSDGTFEVKDWSSSTKEPSSYKGNGSWTTVDETLTLKCNDEEVPEGYTETYKYKIEGNKLIIFDYEEYGPNIFVKI